VIAKVNRTTITATEFKEKAGRVTRLPGRRLDTTAKKQELLNEMINQELLFQAAMKEGFIEESQEIKRKIAREYLHFKVSSEKFEPDENQIKDYYSKRKDEIDRIRASHILIKPKNKKDPKSVLAAKKKAESIRKQILNKDISFAKAAAKHSEDRGNAGSGGDLGMFTFGKMVPEFSRAAFALKKNGDISPVVESSFGFHIIHLTDQQRGLEFHRNAIKIRLEEDKRRSRAERLFEDLRKTSNIATYDERLVDLEFEGKKETN
jgi:parvulin-like peptidyl-prolyl isomerase